MKSNQKARRNQAHIRIPDNLRIMKQSKRQRLALRIRAIGNLDGYYFIISDTNRNLLATDCGFLPTGYTFNRETALLYCLAQVYRYIQANFPCARVVALCATPRLSISGLKEAQAA